MPLYSFFVSLHVVIAILGLGPLTILAIATTRPGFAPLAPERITQLMRLVRGSLAAVFLTGAATIALTHGALGEPRWMRAAFGLFVFLGLLHGLAAWELRRAQRVQPFTLPARSLSRIYWSMCALVAAITYLMEAKPW